MLICSGQGLYAAPTHNEHIVHCDKLRIFVNVVVGGSADGLGVVFDVIGFGIYYSLIDVAGVIFVLYGE